MKKEEIDDWGKRELRISAMFKHAINCPACLAKIAEVDKHSKIEYAELLKKADFLANMAYYFNEAINNGKKQKTA